MIEVIGDLGGVGASKPVPGAGKERLRNSAITAESDRRVCPL
jgi:hypothetical protein